MRRVLVSLAAAALSSALVSTALASTHGGPAKLKLRNTGVGTILVNGRGFTVYAFTKDTRNRDKCSGACRSVWPPVTTVGKPILGKGVNRSLVGTIKLKSGKRQVTYNGHPLYTYVADTRPGQTSYVNKLQFGGRWPALNASGQEVK
jgi:predicted lipoprotein with Yx(FWY)xxD motif